MYGTLLRRRVLGANEPATFAITKLSTTLVAEMIAASACHMIAAFVLFNPKFALRALFEIILFGKFD